MRGDILEGKYNRSVIAAPLRRRSCSYRGVNLFCHPHDPDKVATLGWAASSVKKSNRGIWCFPRESAILGKGFLNFETKQEIC
jgi:hypothetical protein